MRAATPETIPLSNGDTLTFSTEDDAATLLCFSPNTAAVLTPLPGASVSIQAGSSVSFTVAGAANGTYCSVVLPAGSAPPETFDCGAGAESGATLIVKTGRMAVTTVFNGPNWQTGR